MRQPKCGKLNKTWRKRCIKPKGHAEAKRIVDRYHKIEMKKTGTYRSTHVVIWR